MKNVVLKSQGNNSYGGAVTAYVWYQWDDKDDKDDMVEKFAPNLVINHVKNVVSEKKLKMESAVVDRINGLNENGKLGDIKLLDEAKPILGKKENDAES